MEVGQLGGKVTKEIIFGKDNIKINHELPASQKEFKNLILILRSTAQSIRNKMLLKKETLFCLICKTFIKMELLLQKTLLLSTLLLNPLTLNLWETLMLYIAKIPRNSTTKGAFITHTLMSICPINKKIHSSTILTISLRP